MFDSIDAELFFSTESVYRKLGKFDSLLISDEEDFGRENIYWRIVHPYEPDECNRLYGNDIFLILNNRLETQLIELIHAKLWI